MSANSERAKPGGYPPIIALTGFMAVGKSTVGRALANLLKWRFFDLDAEVECRSGQSIQQIFAEHGEARFRQIEAQALRSILEQTTAPTVIALGGGTFVQQENAGLLRQHGVQVVFLELALEHLLQRCHDATQRAGRNPRPLAADEEAFRAAYAQRLPFYRSANVVVAAEGKTPEQIAQEIREALRLGNRPPAP